MVLDVSITIIELVHWILTSHDYDNIILYSPTFKLN